MSKHKRRNVSFKNKIHRKQYKGKERKIQPMTCSSVDYNFLHHFICMSLSPNGDYTMLQSVFNYQKKKGKYKQQKSTINTKISDKGN